MKNDTPRPYGGFWEAYQEIIPAVLRQVKEPGFYIKRQLPPTANPYHDALDGSLPTGAGV